MPWSELVAKYHDGPLRGDKLPNLAVSWGQYRDDFEQPIFEVAEGELTEPIPTEHGWWLLRVDEVVQEDKPALESIKDKVLLSISKRKENLRREELIARVLEERDFQLNEEALGIIYEGLPAEENIVDPVTSKPVPREDLEPLDVPSESYDTVVMSYELSTGPVEMTIADIKAQFDKQNVFERPKKAELIGGLRTKLSNAAEKTIMVDESRERGYFEDERVLAAAYRQVEEMLVDKVHSEILSYEQYVSPDELEAFWAEHADQYESAGAPHRPDGALRQPRHRRAGAGGHRQRRVDLEVGRAPVRQRPRAGADLRPFPARTRRRDDASCATSLFALDKDEISEPFAMDGGSWGVVQVTRILPAEDPTLEEMTEAVSARIRNQRMDVALRELLDEWKKEYPVSVDEDLLATMPSWPEAVQEASESQFQVSREGLAACSHAVVAPFSRRACWPVAALTATAQEPVLLERIVAIVDEEMILQSDLDLAIELYQLDRQLAGEQPSTGDPRAAAARCSTASSRTSSSSRPPSRTTWWSPRRTSRRGSTSASRRSSSQYGSRDNLERALAESGLTRDDFRFRYGNQLRNQQYMRLVVGRFIRPDIEVMENEVEQYYLEHLDEMPAEPDSVTVASILVRVQPTAETRRRVQERVAAAQAALATRPRFRRRRVAVQRGAERAPRRPHRRRPTGRPLRSRARAQSLADLPARRAPASRSSARGACTSCTSTASRTTAPRSLRQIFFPVEITDADVAAARERIERARERVLAGEPFSLVASEVSEDPVSATQGGLMGTFQLDQLSPGVPGGPGSTPRRGRSPNRS